MNFLKYVIDSMIYDLDHDQFLSNSSRIDSEQNHYFFDQVLRFDIVISLSCSEFFR